MKARYVIHVVAPCERAATTARPSCYARSLDLAVGEGCASITFPLISSGIYGYPKEGAWRMALGACLDKLEELGARGPAVTFCVISDPMLELGRQILAEQEAARA